MKLRFLYLTFLCVILLTALNAQTFAKDTWVNVRSKNFFLIGNASEKEIRQIGAVSRNLPAAVSARQI